MSTYSTDSEQKDSTTTTPTNKTPNDLDHTTSNTENTNESSVLGYKRIGRVEPTTHVKNKVEQLADEFILENPPETIGGNITDTDRVLECLAEAVEYFHESLSANHRTLIRDKWGIEDEMINARKIGFVDDTNDVVSHLENAGFDTLTIVRAGLGTASTIKHLFEGTGVSSKNKTMVPEDRWSVEVDEDCTYDVSKEIDTLLRAQLQGLIQPEEIDLEAVASHIESNGEFRVYNWWDNRITFPYRDEDGEFCYLILRSTEHTDDILYSNGIVDRTGEKFTTVSETKIGERIMDTSLISDTDDGERDEEITDSELEAYVVLPHQKRLYNTPDEDDNVEAADKAVKTISSHCKGDVVSDSELLSVGVVHQPDTVGVLEEEQTAQIHVVDVRNNDSYETEFLLTPPATGIEPGSNIEFVNHTSELVKMKVCGTPRDVWWDNGDVTELGKLSCDEPGMYRYEIHVGTETHNGILVCYDTVYTNNRNKQVEQWVGDEPGFSVDLAKYVKQTIDRGWINHDAVNEPIFGCETVHEGKPLIVTEGVTDAIVAHQNGMPCVAPATTNFKEHHYEKICALANDVSTVFIVNDNEVNNAGVNGALRTAKVIENEGHTVRVGTLPRPSTQDKIDLAEYLQTTDRDMFIMNVLQDAIKPEDHELFNPERHDPEYRNNTQNQMNESGEGSNSFSKNSDSTTSLGSGHEWDTEFDASEVSDLYSFELHEVIDFESIDTSSRSGSTIYRGVNPIHHHGNSEGYFVMRDNGEFVTAKDYKIEHKSDGYYYNAQTWLACAANCACDTSTKCDCTRSVTNPAGSLSNSEVWWAWRHAKLADHIDMPEDDPVPMKAIWFLASYHNVYPDEYIPETFDDNHSLPDEKYNEVLRIITDTYGLHPGRHEK